MSSDQEKDLTGFPITGVAPSDPDPELDAPVSPTGSDDPDLEGTAGSGPGDPSYRLGGPLEAADLDTVPEGADEVSPSKPARASLLGRVFGRRRRADEEGADTTEVVRLEKGTTPSDAELGGDQRGDPPHLGQDGHDVDDTGGCLGRLFKVDGRLGAVDAVDKAIDQVGGIGVRLLLREHRRGPEHRAKGRHRSDTRPHHLPIPFACLALRQPRGQAQGEGYHEIAAAFTSSSM